MKGGPFKNKVLYHQITKISLTTEKLTGYPISPTNKGLELFFIAESSCNIKILPKG